MSARLVAALLSLTALPAQGACHDVQRQVPRTISEPYTVTVVVTEAHKVTMPVLVRRDPVTSTSRVTELVGYDRVEQDPVWATRDVTRWYAYAHTNWYTDWNGTWVPVTCGGYWPWDDEDGWLLGEPSCGYHGWIQRNGMWLSWGGHRDWWDRETIGSETYIDHYQDVTRRYPTPPGTPVYVTRDVTTVGYVDVYEPRDVFVTVPVSRDVTRWRNRTIVDTVSSQVCVRPS